MAKPGPKGKTAAQKMARGTLQKCREASNVIQVFDLVQTPNDLPEPPGWFHLLEDEWPGKKYAVALDTFETNRDRLFAQGRLRKMHVDGLANLAVLQATFFEAARSGEISASLVAQITRLQLSLGILPDGKEATATPAAPKVNRFGNNGRDGPR